MSTTHPDMSPTQTPGTPALIRRRRRVDAREAALPLAVLALVVFFAVQSDVFLTVPNFQNVALQAAALALVAFGQCFVILTAGIDLSVGSTVALSSVVTAIVMNHTSVPVGIAAGPGVGIAVGLVNGLVVTVLRVVPFVATLAMLSVASGLALSWSGGTPVPGLPDGFTTIALDRIGGVPLPAVIAAGVFLVGYFILRYSRLGRYIYAVGGNAEAARLSGIDVRVVTASAYVICSFFAACGAVVLTARVASGQPTLGASLALESVAAVVIGGVSLFGGRGSIVGVLFGVAFVSILGNGLNLLNVSSYTQLLVLGAALVAVIALDRRFSRDRAEGN